MTATRPFVESAISLLSQAGYRRLTPPVVVSGIAFDFAAVLVGSEKAIDIVVIANLDEGESRLRQKVEALSRALDVAQSRRSITIVAVVPSLSLQTVEVISRVARLIVLSPGASDEAQRHLLHGLEVLLPIGEPAPPPLIDDPFREVTDWFQRTPNSDMFLPILEAAQSSGAAVTGVLEKLFRQSLTYEAPEG